MKGLLLKEFYVWFKTRSWAYLYVIIYCAAILYSHSDNLSLMGISVFIGLIFNCFRLDSTSGWHIYHKALPCTPAQRVSSKYIVLSAELLTAVALFAVSSYISNKNSESILKPSETEFLVQTVLTFAATVLLISFEIPINVKFTGTKGMIISFIPLIGFLLIYMNIILSISVFNRNAFIKAMIEESWLPAAITVVALLIYAASWLISAVLDANGEKGYCKKFKTAAAVLVAVTIAIIGASVYVLYSQGRFDRENKLYNNSFYDDFGDLTGDTKDAHYSLIDGFCNEFHLGKTLDECAKELESIGYHNSETNERYFYSENKKITVIFDLDTETNLVEYVAVNSSYAKNHLEKATKKDLEIIVSNFTANMTEKEVQDKMKELGLLPETILERKNTDGKMLRYYKIIYEIEDYNGEPETCSINIDCIDGMVDDLRSYY